MQASSILLKALMKKNCRRLRRERTTVRLMVAMYCRDHHGGHELCDGCRELESYADKRIERCPYGGDKPACTQCPIHCYGPEPREMMRQVMRYAGPRMLCKHPYLALWHLFDEKIRRPSVRQKKKRYRPEGEQT